MGFDWGSIAGKFAGGIFGKIGEKLGSWIPTKEERRRNVINKLEKRQKFIEDNKRNDLADEYLRNRDRLRQLYDEAKNAGS